jgi:SAM-dependent methyltransferase
MTLRASPIDLTAAKPSGWAGPAHYDRWFDSPSGRYGLRIEAAAIRAAAGLVGGERALDAGCGTARFGGLLADDGAVVTGIDSDIAVLALARARIKRCGRVPVERLPFADSTFDTVIAVTLLEFVADPATALAELARVTRPRGHVVVGARNPHSPWGLAYRRRLRTGQWCGARLFTRADLRRLAPPHGRARLVAVLYAPGPFGRLAALGPVIEAAGRAVPAWGAFQVLTIDRGAVS